MYHFFVFFLLCLFYELYTYRNQCFFLRFAPRRLPPPPLRPTLTLWQSKKVLWFSSIWMWQVQGFTIKIDFGYVSEKGKFRLPNNHEHNKSAISENFLFCWIENISRVAVNLIEFLSREKVSNLLVRINWTKSHLNKKYATVTAVQMNYKPTKW